MLLVNNVHRVRKREGGGGGGVIFLPHESHYGPAYLTNAVIVLKLEFETVSRRVDQYHIFKNMNSFASERFVSRNSSVRNL